MRDLYIELEKRLATCTSSQVGVLRAIEQACRARSETIERETAPTRREEDNRARGREPLEGDLVAARKRARGDGGARDAPIAALPEDVVAKLLPFAPRPSAAAVAHACRALAGSSRRWLRFNALLHAVGAGDEPRVRALVDAADAPETLGALEFGARCKDIKNCVADTPAQAAAQLSALRQELARLKARGNGGAGAATRPASPTAARGAGGAAPVGSPTDVTSARAAPTTSPKKHKRASPTRAKVTPTDQEHHGQKARAR